MRGTETENGASVKVYAGTISVLLGLNVEPEKRAGLLGSALRRSEGRSGEEDWLNGVLPFPGMEHEAGGPIPTNLAPVQKFRWSGYRVYPDTEYTYAVLARNPAPPMPGTIAQTGIFGHVLSAAKDRGRNRGRGRDAEGQLRAR